MGKEDQGTASRVAQVTGRYVEFQAAVLRALPRDIDPDTQLNWTQNGESLARILREALMAPPSPQLPSYRVIIDFGRTLAQMIAVGKHDWVNDDITAEHFPVQGEGKEEREVVLFHFNRYITSSDAVKEMEKAGCEPDDLPALLSLGEKYPDLQRQFLIAALGSVWQNPRTAGRDVPCLWGDAAGRGLDLLWVENGWYPDSRFAARRKPGT